MRIPKHIIVAASAWGSRLVSIFIQFYSIKILIDILGTNGYAVFVVIASLVGWFVLADFGLGNSLQNKISVRRSEVKEYSDVILSAIIAFIPIVLLFSFLIICFSLDISSFLFEKFNLFNAYDGEKIFLHSSFIFLTTAMGNITFKIWFAEHRGWISNIIPAISSILGLFFLTYLNSNGGDISSKIIFSIYCFYLPAAIIGFFAFLIKVLPLIKFIKNIKKELMLSLIKNGGGFFIFALMSAFVLQADYIIMSQTLMDKDLVTYNILSKIFGLVSFVYAALLQSLWPVCAEANNKKNHHEFKKIEKLYIPFGVVIVICAFFFVFYLNELIVNLLAPGQGIEFSLPMIILFSIYQIVRVWTDTYSMFLLSIGSLKPLWISVPIQAFFSVSLQWIGATHYGLIGMVVGLITSFLITVSWWLPYQFKKIISSS